MRWKVCRQLALSVSFILPLDDLDLLCRLPTEDSGSVRSSSGGESDHPASLREYQNAVESVLEVAFPSEYLRENPSARLEDLKEAPQKLRKLTWDAAVETTTQTLVLVKSHYPRVDLQRFEEGYAADADDDRIDALMSEVWPVAESLVADIEIDGQPL